MPQILLECTHNVIEKDKTSALLGQIHSILSERLPTELSSCKGRVLIHDNYVVGNGDENNAFVHLSIGVLTGRSTEHLDEIARFLMPILKEHFAASLSKLNLQITIAIQDLPKVYLKAQPTPI